MKKLLILAAALAALVSCQKEDPNGESFSKAEVRIEVLNYAKTAAVDPALFNYVTFEVKYREFAENTDPDNDGSFNHPGAFKNVTLNASNTSLIITSTAKPAKDGSNDYCADVIITPVFAETFPESFTLDFCLSVDGVIYNGAGTEIRRSEEGKAGGYMPFTEATFKDLFRNSSYPKWMNSRLSYGYVQRYTTKEWFYNFGVCPIPQDN